MALGVAEFGGTGWCWDSGQSPNLLLRQTPKGPLASATQVAPGVSAPLLLILAGEPWTSVLLLAAALPASHL